MIRKNCQICGRFYYRKPHKAKSSKYCSNKCKYKGLRNKVEVNCDGCGKKMMRHPNLCEQNDKNYCSQKCYHESKKRGEYRNCKECGSEFYVAKHAMRRDTPRGKCCSRECFYKYNKKYPKTLKLRAKVWKRQQRETISDYYVKSTIDRSSGIPLSYSDDIPQELIELKRLNIKRKRKPKSINKK